MLTKTKVKPMPNLDEIDEFASQSLNETSDNLTLDQTVQRSSVVIDDTPDGWDMLAPKEKYLRASDFLEV